MITHLEPDILQCEVKWALGSIAMNKASRNDRIPAKLFTVLKDDVAFNMPANLENWPQDWKRSGFIPFPKKGNVKESSNYLSVVLISHTNKIKLKLIQRINCMGTEIFQMYKLDLEKAEEPEIKLLTSVGS